MSSSGSEDADTRALKAVFIAANEALAEKAENIENADSPLRLTLIKVFPGSEVPPQSGIDVVFLYLSAEEDLPLVSGIVEGYRKSVHKWLLCSGDGTTCTSLF